METPIPAIFTDKAYDQSSTGFKLSTSTVPFVNYTCGFGPFVPDGYGIN